jgi:multidrug efflux pump subunit AcrB
MGPVEARLTVLAFGGLIVVSALLFPLLGQGFLPAGRRRPNALHVRAPAGTRLEKTQQYFAEVEEQIRKLVGSEQIDVMLDNIGLPYSGINIALSDSATVGPMDGEILISLNEKHTPTAKLVAMLRRELPSRFATLQFFFQPADIVDQVLNFGQPAPIDVRVSGPDQGAAFALAAKIARDLTRVAGVVDSHVFQVPNAPALTVTWTGRSRTRRASRSRRLPITCWWRPTRVRRRRRTSGSIPRNSVSYPLVVQVPTYRIGSSQDLQTMPVTSGAAAGSGQLLLNLASFGREAVPMVASQLNIRPVFDVHADVQGRDLYSAAHDIDKVLSGASPGCCEALTVTLSGQVETMRESYTGLFTGIALAIILVYLFLVMNFQSWIDPLIVLMAIPFALGGVLWMLFLSQTPMSVPALMGTLDVHRLDNREQHPGGQLRQSTHGGGRRPAARGRYRRLHALAAGA